MTNMMLHTASTAMFWLVPIVQACVLTKISSAIQHSRLDISLHTLHINRMLTFTLIWLCNILVKMRPNT